MPKQEQNYFSFLLRAWREHEGAEWRFSLQRTSDEKRLNFSNFAGLLAFLSDLFQNNRHTSGGKKPRK